MLKDLTITMPSLRGRPWPGNLAFCHFWHLQSHPSLNIPQGHHLYHIYFNALCLSKQNMKSLSTVFPFLISWRVAQHAQFTDDLSNSNEDYNGLVFCCSLLSCMNYLVTYKMTGRYSRCVPCGSVFLRLAS